MQQEALQTLLGLHATPQSDAPPPAKTVLAFIEVSTVVILTHAYATTT